MYQTWEKSLIVSILSAGTFFGALFAGSLADWIGRRSTIIAGCGVFSVGVAFQVASTTVSVLVPGRLIAGVGVGFKPPRFLKGGDEVIISSPAIGELRNQVGSDAKAKL